MKKGDILFLIVSIVLLLATVFVVERTSPKRNAIDTSCMKLAKGVYYWRTTFELNDYERDFLQRNQIQKLYVRFFDVDVNGNDASDDICVPVATIEFRDSVPADVEIVPTVFITPEAIRHWKTFGPFLARRLNAICQYNNLSPKEFQFDCDWTGSTRDTYFQFLEEMRKQLEQYYPSIVLSTTIRLHQLAQSPPNVDYGVLMCYNTGNFKDYNTKNAILDIDDVKPYLKNLTSYSLPLSLALPAYEWNVQFDSAYKFQMLDRQHYDFTDSTMFEALGHDRYRDKISQNILRREWVDCPTLLSSKDLIFQKRGNPMPIVLYHLDSTQLFKYTNHEITEIYR